MRQPTATKAAVPPRRKPRIKGETVKPDYVLRLMDHVGPTAAAKQIGTTPGTLHKGRNADAISTPYEVAARGIWHELGLSVVESVPPAPRTATMAEAVHAPDADGTVLLLVQVPRGREAFVLPLVERLGGTVVVQA